MVLNKHREHANLILTTSSKASGSKVPLVTLASILQGENSELIIIALYFDDFLLAVYNLLTINWMKLELTMTFEMYLGEAKLCLGLEIECYRAESKL